MTFKATLTCMAIMLAGPAIADDAKPAMDHGAHAASVPMDGYMAAMDKMMDAMADMPAAKNADADFLLMMIPHHQSAIDMALVELEHGQDAQTRAMAQNIIDAQEKEIAEMRQMLTRLGVAAPM